VTDISIGRRTRLVRGILIGGIPHATFQGPKDGHGHNVLLNDNVRASYLDSRAFTTPGGLCDVMH
jgi:hypothetical protein